MGDLSEEVPIPQLQVINLKKGLMLLNFLSYSKSLKQEFQFLYKQMNKYHINIILVTTYTKKHRQLGTGHLVSPELNFNACDGFQR